jgi:tetratricopeptide (TPR) repeat protein
MKISAAFSCLFLCCFMLGAQAYAQSAADPLAQAQALVNKSDYKGAVAILDTYLNAHPTDAHALVLRGDAKDDLNDHIGALIDYDAAIRVNPNYAYAYATRAGTENELGKYDAAIADATKAMALDPTEEMAYRSRAIAGIDSGKGLDTALTDAKKAVSLDNTNAYNFAVVCRAEYALKTYDPALKDCTTAITLDPQNIMALWARGLVYFRQNAWQPSIADFRKTLEIDNTETNAYYWIAQSEYQAQQYTAALQDADTYVKSANNDGDGFLMRARIKLKLGNTAGARDDATEALRQYRIVADDASAGDAQAFLDSLPKP